MPKTGTRMPDRRRPPDRETLIDPKTGKVLYAGKADWQPGATGRRILELLYRYHHMTPRLLAYALEREGEIGDSHVRHQLTRLWRYHFVERFPRLTESGMGSQENVYVPTTLGARLVVDPSDWPAVRKQVAGRVAKPLVRPEHALGLAQLRLMWELAAPKFERIFQTEAFWSDKEYAFKPRVDQKEVYLAPDATVLIAHEAGDYYKPIFLELETTHKNYERLRQRFRAYRELVLERPEIAQRQIEKRTGIVPEKGAVLFLAPTAKEAERLRSFAAQVLEVPKRKAPEFWFGSLDALSKPRERVDATTGRVSVERVLLPPETLFGPVLRNLHGKVGRLVV